MIDMNELRSSFENLRTSGANGQREGT